MFSFMLTMILSFASCDDDDDDVKIDKTLIIGKWQTTGLTASQAIVWEEGKAATKDLYSLMNEDEKDDVQELAADGYVNWYDSPASEEPYDIGNIDENNYTRWEIKGGNIIQSYSESYTTDDGQVINTDSYRATIISINEKTLVLDYPYEDNPKVSITETLTKIK